MGASRKAGMLKQRARERKKAAKAAKQKKARAAFRSIRRAHPEGPGR